MREMARLRIEALRSHSGSHLELCKAFLHLAELSSPKSAQAAVEQANHCLSRAKA